MRNWVAKLQGVFGAGGGDALPAAPLGVNDVATDYTSLRIRGLTAGGGLPAELSAGVEHLARAMSLARVVPTLPTKHPAEWLANATRSLVVNGHHASLIRARDFEEIRLTSITSREHDRSTWRYMATVLSPDGDRVIEEDDKHVLFCVYGAGLRKHPEFGLIRQINVALAGEVRTPSGTLIVTGADQHTLEPRRMEQLYKAIYAEPATRAIVANLGDSAKLLRLQADPAEALLKLRSALLDELLAVSGVPALAVSPTGAGGGIREAAGAVRKVCLAIAEVVSDELQRKLGQPFAFEFPRDANELTMRARALKSLVDSGVGLDRALRLAGLAT